MRRHLGLLPLAVLVLVSSACPPPPDPGPEPTTPPAWSDTSDVPLTIGRGWEDFKLYDGVDGLPVTPGFQGGQHVHVTFLSPDLTIGDNVSRVLTWYVDPNANDALLDGAYETYGDLEALPTAAAALAEEYGGVGSPFATAFLQDLSLIGADVELRVHVELSDGRIGRGSIADRLGWEYDLPGWAEFLCGGGDWCTPDAGPTDAGPVDAGATDAGVNDAGPSDGGGSDAGPSDAGGSDAG